MKKTYSAPEIDVTLLYTDQLLRTSGVDINEEDEDILAN